MMTMLVNTISPPPPLPPRGSVVTDVSQPHLYPAVLYDVNTALQFLLLHVRVVLKAVLPQDKPAVLPMFHLVAPLTEHALFNDK